MNIKKLQKDLEIFFKKKGYTTSAAIADLLEMQQSTVHRSLYNKHLKLTKGIMRLCNYANFDVTKYSDKDPASNRYLMEALNLVWNGTDAHAKQLSRLLMVAHSCKLNGNQNEA
jgi:DNA-directed RNA polymerase specialized sigma54-like protein